MAVPKRKTSKARRDRRRSNVWKLDAPTLVKCPQCGASLFKKTGKLGKIYCAKDGCGYERPLDKTKDKDEG